jgi:hypothetical protein
MAASLANGVFLLGPPTSQGDATILADGVALSSPLAAKARAAVGVQDEDGMLEWAELAPDVAPTPATAKSLDTLLAKNGCSMRMAVVATDPKAAGDTRALLGGTLDLAGEPQDVGTAVAARLVRGQAPGASLYFESTPVVPPAVWQPLQSQRVRYFRKPPKKSASSGGGSAGGSAPK